MKINQIIVLVLVITAILSAQVDSVGVKSPNLIIKELRSDDKSLKDTPLNSSGIDSTCASYYKTPAHPLKKQNRYPMNDMIVASLTPKNSAIGYLYSMDKNCKFAGHGLSLKFLGDKVGFQSYLTHQEFEDTDTTKHYYPAEVTNVSSSDLPFKVTGTIKYISPLVKQTVFGLDLIIKLHKNDKSMLYLTTGTGLDYKTKMKFHRGYQITSSENYYYTYYNFKYTGPETTELSTLYYGFVTFGLGGSYNLSENLQLSGEVKLKGEKGISANYSPLPNVALHYIF